SQEVKPDSIISRFHAPDGREWEWRWTMEPGAGDLVLNTTAHSSQPVELFRAIFFGADIVDHKLVSVNSSGVGEQFRAPWNEKFIGDPEKDASPMSAPAPLIALFEGEKTGWLIEGRD